MQVNKLLVKKIPMKKILMQVLMKRQLTLMKTEAFWFFYVLFVLLDFLCGLCPEYLCSLKCSWSVT